jgi:acylphosphatase
MKRVRAIVSGRVQGVWYRAHTQEKAQEMGVVGYVRNCADGTVEIVAEGEEHRVEALLDWAREGPPMAQVADLSEEILSPDEEFHRFEVRY